MRSGVGAGPTFVLEMRDGSMVRDMKIDKRSKIMKQVPPRLPSEVGRPT